MASRRNSGPWPQAGEGIVCRFQFAPCLPEAERIVALGFRCWMLGLSTGDIKAWERTWDLYSGLFGTVGARVAVSRLARWVVAVDQSAQRSIDVFPQSCRSFCRDECIAVSLVAACQHQAFPAARAYAAALIDDGEVEESVSNEVLASVSAFADALSSLEHRLSLPRTIALPSCASFVSGPLH